MPGFRKEPEFTIGRRTVCRGDRVRVKGFRGVWTFLALVYPNDKRRKGWVDVYKDGQGHRSFSPDRIRKVK